MTYLIYEVPSNWEALQTEHSDSDPKYITTIDRKYSIVVGDILTDMLDRYVVVGRSMSMGVITNIKLFVKSF